MGQESGFVLRSRGRTPEVQWLRGGGREAPLTHLFINGCTFLYLYKTREREKSLINC